MLPAKPAGGHPEERLRRRLRSRSIVANKRTNKTASRSISLSGLNTGANIKRGGGGGGGDSDMKGAGLLIVSFRGVNLGSGCQFGCSEKNATKFSRQGLV